MYLHVNVITFHVFWVGSGGLHKPLLSEDTEASVKLTMPQEGNTMLSGDMYTDGCFGDVFGLVVFCCLPTPSRLVALPPAMAIPLRCSLDEGWGQPGWGTTNFRCCIGLGWDFISFMKACLLLPSRPVSKIFCIMHLCLNCGWVS